MALVNEIDKRSAARPLSKDVPAETNVPKDPQMATAEKEKLVKSSAQIIREATLRRVQNQIKFHQSEAKRLETVRSQNAPAKKKFHEGEANRLEREYSLIQNQELREE